LIVDNDKPLETVRRGGFGHSGLWEKLIKNGVVLCLSMKVAIL
jgi:hypothetical protein